MDMSSLACTQAQCSPEYQTLHASFVYKYPMHPNQRRLKGRHPSLWGMRPHCGTCPRRPVMGGTLCNQSPRMGQHARTSSSGMWPAPIMSMQPFRFRTPPCRAKLGTGTAKKCAKSSCKAVRHVGLRISVKSNSSRVTCGQSTSGASNVQREASS